MRFVRLLSSRKLRFLAVTVVALLACDAAAAYQVGVRAKRPPSFRRGGRFVEASGDGSHAPTAGPSDTTTTTALSGPGTDSS